MLIQQPNHNDRRAAMTGASASTAAGRKHRSRRGLSVVWLIVTVPLLLTLSCLVIDVAHVWLARVELENGLEAAALAAVQDWAEGPDSDTLHARRVGVAYACQNRLRGCPIVIGTNYDPDNGGVNQNDECCIGPGDLPGDPPKGNLIFGAIDDSNPDKPVTFNAGLQASCGALGTILFDVNGQGEGSLANDNAWGIAFLRTAETPPNLTIVSVTYNLRTIDPDAYFDFTSSGPLLSDSSPSPIIAPQLDVVGFTNPGAQITFSPTTGTSPTLTINFGPDPGPGGDLGFEPCDRIRFGALVDKLGPPPGWAHDDADAIGYYRVQVTVVFALGGVPQPPVTATFWHTNDITCLPPYIDLLDPYICVPEHYIVHPTGIPDLPCPHSGPPGNPYNNGQSYVLLSGGGLRPPAVRAQARACVPSLWRYLFGDCIGPRCITVKTTAMYDCETQRPRLVKLDDYICPGPDPSP